MITILENFHLAWPQLIVLITACLVLISAMIERHPHYRCAFGISLVGLALSASLAFVFMGLSPEVIFGGEYASDDLTQLLIAAIGLSVFFILIYSRGYMIERQMPVPDILALTLFSTVGMMILVGANSMLSSYLGLELLSLPLYALTAVRRTEGDGSEAAMKYFVMGAMASGMLLFGFSLLYAVTGQLNFDAIASALSHLSNPAQPMVTFGLVFMLAGLAFKLALVPFHMWAPDVYEGAPLSVTLLISSAPKFAALAFMLRLLSIALPDLVSQWQPILLAMTLLSVALGNVFAVAQTNLRRLFAYSAIAHMGFVVLGIQVANVAGYASALHYLLIYVMMTIAAFGLLVLLSRGGIEVETLDDLKGLNQKNPWAAAMMMIILFSMAGVPPTAGFLIKLSVLKALVDAGMITVAVIAVLFTVIGAFYYLRVVKVMYFDEPEAFAPVCLGNKVTQACFSINSLALLYFGLFPGALIAMCSNIFMS